MEQAVKNIYISLPLPMTRKELDERNIAELDFVLISGDAYIDHPSFGPAIIGRTLESHGYTVGIIAQPDWHGPEAFRALGRPRLAFLITSGNMDSMVNHYTASRKRRNDDAYTPGGKTGARPDRAATVYANRAREAYKGVPVIMGGIEASLRRFAHYDYWDDKVRRSILVDSAADFLVYGMGERAVVELADALDSGLKPRDITYVAGTAFKAQSLENIYDYTMIGSFDEVSSDKKAYARVFLTQYEEQDPIRGKRLVQKHGNEYVVVNPPAMPLGQTELDEVYALPYTRKPHPSYTAHIPALDEVEFSLTSCRGCFGACSFCALTFHQGRIVQSRSYASLVGEAKLLVKQPDFKGYIHDVGGPTANFRRPACARQLKEGACKNRQCLGFHACKRVDADHTDYVALLRKLRDVQGVKRVFVRSGVRYDYAMLDKNDAFLRELVAHHVSGQLKVAPEHVDDKVLKLMGKPSAELYERFLQKYGSINRALGKEQFIVPYFMSSHPGSDLTSAVELALFLKRTGQRPEQVQDFYPTPGTLSTCMYFAGLDPRTMEQVYVPRSYEEKAMQRALMQYFMPQYRAMARKALIKAGREDLVGYGKDALVPPEREKREARPTRSAPAAQKGRERIRKKNRAPRERGRKR
ncbi:MAG TPA: YgiQ family radical SAM protein [Clostridia bacterium]|nr:YgiQ family radical SAM protein [Clostridia bacterium]